MWGRFKGLVDPEAEKVRVFEEIIKKGDPSAIVSDKSAEYEEAGSIVLEDLFNDIEGTIKLLKTVASNKRVFKQDRVHFFLKVMSEPIRVKQDDHLKRSGESLLYFLIFHKQVELLAEMIRQVKLVELSLNDESFVNAILRPIHVRMAGTMVVVEGIFLSLARTEPGVALLKIIANGMMGVLRKEVSQKDNRRSRAIFKALMRKKPSPLDPEPDNPTEYETVFENLVATDDGVAVLSEFQEVGMLQTMKGAVRANFSKKETIFSDPVRLAEELMRRIDDKALISQISEKAGGNELIISWLMFNQGVFFHCSKLDTETLIGVLETVQLRELSKLSVDFAKVLVREIPGEKPALSYWLECKKAVTFLKRLFDQRAMRIREKEVLIVQKALEPEKYTEGVNQLVTVMSQDGGMELIRKLLGGDFIAEGGTQLYDSTEKLFEDIVQQAEPGVVPALYAFCQPPTDSGDEPIITLLLKYKALIEFNLDLFAWALTLQADDPKQCGLEILLSYPKGRRALHLYLQEIPQLWIAMLKQDPKAITYFRAIPDFIGVPKSWSYFLTYVENTTEHLEGAEVILGSMEQKDDEGMVMFNACAVTDEGGKALHALMKRAPKLFTTEGYAKRWVALLSTPGQCGGELVDFAGITCLAFSVEGCKAIKHIVKDLGVIIDRYSEQFFQGLTHTVDAWTDKWNGVSAVSGLALTEPAALQQLWTDFPDCLRGKQGEQFKAALVSPFALETGKATAVSLLLSKGSVFAFCDLYMNQRTFYASYKDDIFAAAVLHPEGLAWLTNAMFSQIDGREHDPHVISCFLQRGDFAFIERIVTALNQQEEEIEKELAKQKEQLKPKEFAEFVKDMAKRRPRFDHFWVSLLAKDNEQAYNMTRFARTEEGSAVLKELLLYITKISKGLSVPQNIRELVKNALTKGVGAMGSIEETFARCSAGCDVVFMIKEACKGYWGKKLSPSKERLSPDDAGPAGGVQIRKHPSRDSIMSRGSMQTVRLSDRLSTVSSPEEFDVDDSMAGSEVDAAAVGVVKRPSFRDSFRRKKSGSRAYRKSKSEEDTVMGVGIEDWLAAVPTGACDNAVGISAQGVTFDEQDEENAAGEMAAAEAVLTRQGETEDGGDEYIAVDGAPSGVSIFVHPSKSDENGGERANPDEGDLDPDVEFGTGSEASL